MEQNYYDALLKLPFDNLTDLFIKKYSDFHSTYVMQEIFYEVDTSYNIQKFIQSATKDNPPTAAEIVQLVRKIPYFFFARAGSRCVAALTILTLWENKYDKGSGCLDNDHLVTLCADIISQSVKQSILVDRSFFDSFYSEVAGDHLKLDYQVS